MIGETESEVAGAASARRVFRELDKVGRTTISARPTLTDATCAASCASSTTPSTAWKRAIFSRDLSGLRGVLLAAGIRGL